jgi:flagellar hook-associated protein 1 FlgK
MGTLFTTLLNSTGALRVYGSLFNVIQNNITNANTPGYVKQDQVLVSLPFQPDQGIAGGVAAGPVLSSRSVYLEQAVRGQNQLLGYSQQRATDLAVVESQFDLTASYGVANGLTNFFNGFSQLAVNPNDSVARQSVLDQASQVAGSFNQTALALQQASTGVDKQTQDTVNGINRIADQIAGINHVYRASASASQDAGLDAQLNSALEELSGLANYTIVRTADGAANVFLGGQTMLVFGDKSMSVSTDLSSAQTVIRDSNGNDVTSQVTSQTGGGQLGALLGEKNKTIPGYMDQLNTLAASFADNVNATLAQGVGRDGLPPPTGLFTYDPVVGAAGTLAVNPLTPDQVAAALPTAPGGNGNAIAMAQLANQPVANGFTFTEAFGNLGSKVGRDVQSAQTETDRYKDSLAQARQFRSDQTGVSLDEQAALVLQFQQAYQAVGKLISVVNDLTQTVMNIIQ